MAPHVSCKHLSWGYDDSWHLNRIQGQQSSAYTRLWCLYQQREQEMEKIKGELDCLKYVLSSLSVV